MMESVEHLRKKLTSNLETEIFIECLMNEEDLEQKFTRDEYCSIIQKDFLTPFLEFLKFC